MDSALGAYVHIPFCIQRCSYCDFATYSKDQIEANDDYVTTVCREIETRRDLFSKRALSTLYFGGGTPSLLEPYQLARIVNAFEKNGFPLAEGAEVTLEVNPATLTEQKCQGYRDIGVNRVSIGCQSFNDDYLKACNREHNVAQTFETILLAKKYFDNYSLDLLFSLPQQRPRELQFDLDELCKINPPHISAYCLTLPEKHPMNEGRCSEREQEIMFAMTVEAFDSIGLQRYEISNFARPGFESKHNNLYWTDQDYWASGLSAHSYRRNPGWGTRFWNPSGYKQYIETIAALKPAQTVAESFGSGLFEELKKHESATDFCHTHLRLSKGLSSKSVRQKFGDALALEFNDRAETLRAKGLLRKKAENFALTDRGVLLSNRVFAELLFSPQDVDNP